MISRLPANAGPPPWSGESLRQTVDFMSAGNFCPGSCGTFVDVAAEGIIMIPQEGGGVGKRRLQRQHNFQMVVALAKKRKVILTAVLKNKLAENGITLRTVCEVIAGMRPSDYSCSLESKLVANDFNHPWQDTYESRFGGTDYYIKLMIAKVNGCDCVRVLSFKPDGAFL
jgi:hypothetical protein